MLSESYVMDVSYTQGDSNFTVESWFVKVPKSLETFTLDQMEIFMYDYLHPLLQTFASNACGDPNTIQMPIPLSRCLLLNLIYSLILYGLWSREIS